MRLVHQMFPYENRVFLCNGKQFSGHLGGYLVWKTLKGFDDICSPCRDGQIFLHCPYYRRIWCSNSHNRIRPNCSRANNPLIEEVIRHIETVYSPTHSTFDRRQDLLQPRKQSRKHSSQENHKRVPQKHSPLHRELHAYLWPARIVTIPLALVGIFMEYSSLALPKALSKFLLIAEMHTSMYIHST